MCTNLFCFEDPEHVWEESAADKTNSCLGVVQEPDESSNISFEFRSHNRHLLKILSNNNCQLGKQNRHLMWISNILLSFATITIIWKRFHKIILNSRKQIFTWSPRAWRPPCRGRSSAEASLWSSRRRSDGCHSGPDGFIQMGAIVALMGSDGCHSGLDFGFKIAALVRWVP